MAVTFFFGVSNARRSNGATHSVHIAEESLLFSTLNTLGQKAKTNSSKKAYTSKHPQQQKQTIGSEVCFVRVR